MKTLEDLKSIVDKYYWEHQQHIVVESMIQLTKDGCLAEVYLKDGDWLFDIQTYKNFEDVDIVLRQYKTDSYQICKYENIYKASTSPYYCNRMFTLNKFEGITEEDILNATRYFVKEVLGEYCYFNFKFNKENQELYEPLEIKVEHETIVELNPAEEATHEKVIRILEVRDELPNCNALKDGYCNNGYACDSCPDLNNQMGNS